MIKKRIQESIKAKKAFLLEAENIRKVSQEIIKCFSRGNKLLIFGNGGSAADAQHIAGELVGRYKLERRGLPAISLTTDTSILTAWSNDYSFDTIFERQVEALANKGDILLGISTSGNSPNIIKAFEKGMEIGSVNISLTGDKGGKLKKISNYNVNSTSKNTPIIQECHQTAYHIICELVERAFK